LLPKKGLKKAKKGKGTTEGPEVISIAANKKAAEWDWKL